MGRGPRRHYVARVDDAEPRHAYHPGLARRLVSCRRTGVSLLTRTLALTPAESVVLAHGAPIETVLGRQPVTAEVRTCGCGHPQVHAYGGVAFRRRPRVSHPHYRLTLVLPGAGEPLADRCLASRGALAAALRGEPCGPGLLQELLVRGSVRVSHYPHHLEPAAREAYALTIPSAYYLRWCRDRRHRYHLRWCREARHTWH